MSFKEANGKDARCEEKQDELYYIRNGKKN